jgi:hypothetical protein
MVADADWTMPGCTIEVTCTASDPEDDELSYVWSADGGSISGTGKTVDWSAPEEVGIYNITVVVIDGHGMEATRRIPISAVTGTPPTIEELIVTANHKYLKENGTGYDYKVGEKREYNIECEVSDTSVGVSYNWSCQGGEISVISADGSTITWTAPDIRNDYFAVTVIVSDVAENSVSKSVVFHVVSCSVCTFG